MVHIPRRTGALRLWWYTLCADWYAWRARNAECDLITWKVMRDKYFDALNHALADNLTLLKRPRCAMCGDVGSIYYANQATNGLGYPVADVGGGTWMLCPDCKGSSLFKVQ